LNVEPSCDVIEQETRLSLAGTLPASGRGRPLRRMAVLCALGLALAAWAGGARGDAISIAGDAGDVGATLNTAPQHFPAPPGADEPMLLDFQACPRPKVHADLAIEDPVVVAPVPALQLTARTVARRHAAGTPGDDLGPDALVMGDYRPNFVFHTAYRLHLAMRPDRSIHACVAELDVTAQFAATITLAREIPPASCLAGEVLDHERGHWAIDKALLPSLLPGLEQAAAAGVASGFDVASTQELQYGIAAALSNSLAGFLDSFGAARQAEQAAHDSAQERVRIERSCGGAAAGVAARIRRAPAAH
jgi:hypothetical protein